MFFYRNHYVSQSSVMARVFRWALLHSDGQAEVCWGECYSYISWKPTWAEMLKSIQWDKQMFLYVQVLYLSMYWYQQNTLHLNIHNSLCILYNYIHCCLFQMQHCSNPSVIIMTLCRMTLSFTSVTSGCCRNFHLFNFSVSWKYFY